jgi:hypothetical protein
MIIAKIPDYFNLNRRGIMNRSAAIFLRISLFLFLLLTASGLQAAQEAYVATPAAVMPETQYDFPDTIDGEYVIHDFVIRNQGDAVLNVLKVKTT